MFSTYPWAVWGARLRALVTEETEAMLGAYQVSPQVSRASMHGLNWEMNGGDGVMMIGQYGWSHEFFRPAVQASSNAAKSSDGNPGADGKSLASPAADVLPHGLPGHY
jgi:porin